MQAAFDLVQYTVYVKHRGQTWPGKGPLIGVKLHSGSTMTRKSVNLTQLDPNLIETELSQSDPIICQVCKKKKKKKKKKKTYPIPGHFWPGTEYDPNGPFSGSRWPWCFTVYKNDNNKFVLSINFWLDSFFGSYCYTQR